MSRKSNKRNTCSKSSSTVKCDDDTEKLFSQILERLNGKSCKEREGAAQSLCDTLVHHFVPNLVEENRYALKNFIENSIKRGKASEQLLGAKLAALLALQLGPLELSIFDFLNQLLLSTIKDQSLQTEVREKLCAVFGLFNFFGCDDVKHVRVTMRALIDNLDSTFSLSGKGDNRKSLDDNMIAETLSAWTLLLTSIPLGERVSSRITLPFVRKLLSCLDSPQIEVRVAASEALCVIWESGRLENVDYLDRIADDFINAVRKLATDSNRFRGKRELKFQRATFRDVLLFLEKDILPEITVRFDSGVAVLNSWAKYVQYSALCRVVGPGMTNHLETNNFIRELFQLSSTLYERPELVKHTSNSRMLKQKTPANTRNRDKCFSTSKVVRQGKGRAELCDAKLLHLMDALVAKNGMKGQIKDIREMFRTGMYTWDTSNELRAKCCIAIGLLSLSLDEDPDEILGVMSTVNSMLVGCYLTACNQHMRSDLLYSASLITWGLLVTLLPPEKLVSLMTERRKRFSSELCGKYFVTILNSSYLEARLAAAKTVALVLERGRLHDSNFLREHLDDFIVALRRLNTDLQDPRNSNNPINFGFRKFHRATCQDVLKYIEMNTFPGITVPVGKEIIILDTWALYFRYSAECIENGPEMGAFLEEKSLIPKNFVQEIASSLQGVKQTKLELNLLSTKSSKERSLCRSENRDIRLTGFA